MKALKNKKLIITAAVAVVVLAGAITAYLVISKRSKQGDAPSAAGSGTKLLGGTLSTLGTSTSSSAATSSTDWHNDPLYPVAMEVYRGRYGNDPERTQKLTAEGYDAKAVQALVNKIDAEQKAKKNA